MPETRTETIVPLVCKFCQQALTNEDPTLPAVARNIGKLCHGLSGNSLYLDKKTSHKFTTAKLSKLFFLSTFIFPHLEVITQTSCARGHILDLTCFSWLCSESRRGRETLVRQLLQTVVRTRAPPDKTTQISRGAKFLSQISCECRFSWCLNRARKERVQLSPFSGSIPRA